MGPSEDVSSGASDDDALGDPVGATLGDEDEGAAVELDVDGLGLLEDDESEESSPCEHPASARPAMATTGRTLNFTWFSCGSGMYW